MTADTDLLTLTAAGDLTGYNANTIARAIAAGHLAEVAAPPDLPRRPGVPPRYVRRADVLAWLHNAELQARSAAGRELANQKKTRT